MDQDPRVLGLGGRGEYTKRYTSTTRVISVIRQAAVSAIILNVLLIARGKGTRQCSLITIFKKKGKAKVGIEPTSFVYQPNAYRWAKTAHGPARLRWEAIYL